MDAPQENVECKSNRSRVGRLRLMAVATASAGALLLGGGVFAAWSPSASMTSGSMGAANLAVTVVDANGTSFNTGVSNLLPGDYFNRYADLTNTGSVNQTFSGTVVGTGLLAPAMSVQVDLCSVAWAANGTCGGTTTSIAPETSTASTVSLTFPSLAPNAVGRAKFRYKLDSAASQSVYQGKSGGMQVNLVGSSTVAGGQDRTAN